MRRRVREFYWVRLDDTGSLVSLCGACTRTTVDDLLPRRVRGPFPPSECDRCGKGTKAYIAD